MPPGFCQYHGVPQEIKCLPDVDQAVTVFDQKATGLITSRSNGTCHYPVAHAWLRALAPSWKEARDTITVSLCRKPW